MAIYDGKFIRGTVGDLVYKVIRGKQVVCERPIPGSVRQSEASKASALLFGKSASLGSQIRKTFEINKESLYDSTATQRLVSILRKILKESRNPETKNFNFSVDSFSSLRGFNFNQNAKMQNVLPFIPKVSISNQVMKVETYDAPIPEILRFPKDSFKGLLKISMSLFRLKDGLMLGEPEKLALEFNRNMESVPAHTFTFNVPNGCLCMVTCAISFTLPGKTGSLAVNDTKFNSHCICGALITPGVYQTDPQRKRWDEMVKFE